MILDNFKILSSLFIGLFYVILIRVNWWFIVWKKGCNLLLTLFPGFSGIPLPFPYSLLPLNFYLSWFLFLGGLNGMDIALTISAKNTTKFYGYYPWIFYGYLLNSNIIWLHEIQILYIFSYSKLVQRGKHSNMLSTRV